MLRAGLIGFGMAGRVFHGPLLSSVEGIELAAVLERRGNEAASRYPAIQTYRTLGEILGDSSLDFLVLATPSGTHFELARAILEAGKNLVVDKPVCPTAAEIAALMELATKKKAALIPFHNRRWDGDFLTVRKILHDKELGRVVSCESTFDRWRPQPRPNAWRERNQPGSGVLLDLGPHLIDQALSLFGMPEGVSAQIAREREPFDDANDSFSVRLDYPGMTATLGANCLTAPPRPRFHLRGTRGNFWKHGLDPQEAQLTLITRIDTPGWGREPDSAWGHIFAGPNATVVERPVETVPGDYRLFYAGVRDFLLGKAPPPVRIEDALQVARILQAAQLSLNEKRIITGL